MKAANLHAGHSPAATGPLRGEEPYPRPSLGRRFFVVLLAITSLAWCADDVMLPPLPPLPPLTVEPQPTTCPATEPTTGPADSPEPSPATPPETMPSPPQTHPAPPFPGQHVERTGDEIMVCGQLFHTGGAPVVLWIDPGGYDAYRVERRFVPFDQSSWEATAQAATAIKTPNRYNLRESVLTPAEIERVRGGGWDLGLLQAKVDQFVIHYDACGISRQCFAVLQDGRGLSSHFLLDLDGTIYQTLDLKERAWHATISNSRSIGIEIANVGAYLVEESDPFSQWYTRDKDRRLRITIPSRFGDGGIRTPDFVGRPIRHRLIRGTIQGYPRKQYDFTPEQYESLIKLTATLCTIFPRIACDYPRDAEGHLIRQKLPDDKLAAYQGVLGHYHVQADKIDPGPAFQWDRVIDGARQLMPPPPALPSDDAASN